MILELSVEEINVILQVLGEVPTKSGLYPLLVKIKQQGENQPGQQQMPEATPVPAE